MVPVYINYINSYLPSKLVSNDELGKWNVYSSDQILTKIGIKNRYVANDNEYVSDLAIEAVKLLFYENKFDSKSIDAVIFCTQSPDLLIPGPEYIIHNKFNLSNNCICISINSGCTGYLHGLSLALSLINSYQANRVLFITSETYSKHIAENDIGNRSIFGDAATATLISNENIGLSLRLGGFNFFSDGSGYNKIINNGSLIGSNSSFKSFEMIGSDVFLFASSKVVNFIQEFLLKSKLKSNDIDLFVFHQASKMVLDSLQRKLKIPDERFVCDFENTGNTVSNTIPIALSNYFINNPSQRPSKVLLCGFGVGLSIGITVLDL